MGAPNPVVSAPSGTAGGIDREIRSLHIFLCLVLLIGAVSMAAPNLFVRLRMGILPQMMFVLAILVRIIHLLLASQRKLLHEVSAALSAASAYVWRLEQYAPIDPQTDLFNRRYLDQLFQQQMAWVNRTGKAATLLLFQFTLNGQAMSDGEVAREASRLLLSNFRGSDFIVRNSPDEILVLLPETDAEQARFALNRLADKVDHWNLETQGREMQVRQKFSTCYPGGNLWENLRQAEEALRSTTNAPSLQKTPLIRLQNSQPSLQ